MKRPLAILLTTLALGAGAADLPQVEIYKSPYCGYCADWAKHMADNGFKVKTLDVEDVPAARARLGMPERYGSCHTARIGNYVVEGHVPAEDIKRLLKEQPKAVGLAAPGMPGGSPGMESARKQPYDVLLVDREGKARVFAKH